MENKTSKYLKYAVGEIILVVIGILIALQINNWNEERKVRAQEVNYLKNLKADLEKEIENTKQFANYRYGKAQACSSLLNGTAPNSIEAVAEYTNLYERVFAWSEFVPNNNTFKELLSSGNLSLITNDNIKNGLLELDKRYTQITNGEHHMRREFEAYLYDPHVEHIDAVSFFDTTQPVYGYPNRLTAKDIPFEKHDKLIKEAAWQHNNAIFKNGLRLAFMNNGYLAGVHKELVYDIEEIVTLIDQEITK
ncbi:hypothetical protein J4050_10430 [Winogradskyella sp. DF17]|uniref:Uncharacterized protein n=2 Tax=Winogradskyella pelagia TaxID=2819984 RepID=A0ABS3T342_9FLAO|nr:hypothetical protein [Winogradskyella sp. DF17]